jgi:hypothetical protein
MRLTAVLIVFQLSRKEYLAVLFEWNFFFPRGTSSRTVPVQIVKLVVSQFPTY